MFIYLLATLTLFSCGKINSVLDKAESIPGKMDGLNENTKELERLSVVSASVIELNKSENYEIIFPAPLQIIPFAKKAAENMLVQKELVPFIYTKIKIINDVSFDDVNLFSIESDKKMLTREQFEKNKLGLFYVIQSICGFLPEEKVDELIAMLKNSDEYSETIVKMLAMRADFIDKILLNTKYTSGKLVNMGAIEAAIDYNKSLEKILRLPFASEISAEFPDMFSLNPDLNALVKVQLDKESSLKNWKSIKAGAMNFYKLGQFSTEQGQVESQKARLQANLAIIDQAINAWGPATP